MLLVGVVTASVAENPWTWLGTEKSKIDAVKNKDEIMAYVNGEPVTYGDLVHMQTMIEFNNRVVGASEPADAAAAFVRLTKSKVITSVAKQEGLWPSDEQTREHIKAVRDSYSILGGDAKKELDQFLRGLGISEDEYFNSYAFEGYRAALATGLLRAKIASKYEGMAPEEVEQRIDKEIQSMTESAEVKILNAALKSSLQ